jgi:1,5-anhydro-D-fructose reductase (1,5-anhydro-D-mannitol-forming)
VSEVGWGFIGASTWARRWLVPAVRATPRAVPVAVFSTSAERGRAFAGQCGLPRSYDSLEALLADPDVGAVYVSTRNDLHASQTIAAARAGKHVLCEKPLALLLADARSMCRECEQAGVVFAVDHHLRGAATIVRMRELIVEGAIGEVVAARVFHAGSLAGELRTWRLDRPDAGGGVVLDLTVHDADTIRFLLGDEVDQVVALTSSGTLGAGLVEDSAMGVMRMRGGPLVSFHDSFVTPDAPAGVEVHGSDGSLIASDVLGPEPEGEVWLLRGGRREPVAVQRGWGLYERAVQRFMSAVAGTGSVLASGEDGVRSLAVALAALESAAGGGGAVAPGA